MNINEHSEIKANNEKKRKKYKKRDEKDNKDKNTIKVRPISQS